MPAPAGYEAKGNTNKAVTYYATFVDPWKNADRELQPHVEAVRKRLARLNESEKRVP